MPHSLLTEKTFTIKYHFQKNSTENLTLPELIHCLHLNKPFFFPKLQAHQKHGFYSFLANLIALCLQNLDINPSSLSIPQWTDLLKNLAPDHPTAFDLFVDDLSLPAFFQNPTKDLVDDNITHPDLLDYHHSKKDWDIKLNRVDPTSIEHWIYYLINIQTMSNYGGSKTYGTTKTASGTSNRICASFVNEPFFHSRIQRDVPLLISKANENALGLSLTGHKLLWLIPRDVKTQISLTDCHPLFIDCSRIYRFIHKYGNIRVLKKLTKGIFIQEKLNGNVGDFWLPIVNSEAINLTTRFNSSLTYGLMANNYYKTPAVSLPSESSSFKKGFLYLEGLVSGGNCKSASFDRKYLIMSKGLISRFSKASKEHTEFQKIDTLAKRYLTYAQDFFYFLVKNPILNVLSELKMNVSIAQELTDLRKIYDHEIDAISFDYILPDIESDTNSLEKEWINKLDQITTHFRELLYQKLFSEGIYQFEAFAILNKQTRTQRYFLKTKKLITTIEVAPHMKVSDIKMRNQVYHKVNNAMGIILAHKNDNSFLATLRQKHIDPSFNSSFQQLKITALNNHTLSQKEERVWSHIFAWMSKIDKKENVKPFGEVLKNSGVNNIRLHRILTLSGEALLSELNSTISFITSKGSSESSISWLDVALLLLSEDTEDSLLTRKMIADSYYRTQFSKGNSDE